MHLIDESNDRANMAYVGDLPWHSLGQELTVEAPIETWVVEAGLNYGVKTSPTMFVVGGKTITVPDSKTLYRDDTNAPLGIVSETRFHESQPSEVLEFYRDLVSASGDFTLETAGALDGGKQVWAMAKYKKVIDVGGDILKPYLLLTDAFTGKKARIAQFTTVRVVCNNTLEMSLRQDVSSSVRIPHTRKFDASAVKAELGLAAEKAETFAEDVERLAAAPMKQAQFIEFMTDLYAKRDAAKNITNTKWLTKIIADGTELFENGPGADLKTAKGTAWGALNVVTHLEDFDRKALDNDSRFRSAQFGEGKRIKRRAVELLAA